MAREFSSCKYGIPSLHTYSEKQAIITESTYFYAVQKQNAASLYIPFDQWHIVFRVAYLSRFIRAP